METYTLSEPPVQPPPQEQQEQKPKTFFDKYGKILLIIGIIFGLLSMFLLGLLLSSRGAPTQTIEQPTPTPTPIEETPVISQQIEGKPTMITYPPGKKYYDDALAIITKEEPYHVLFISLARVEQTNDYAQYTTVNYYDGKNWLRESVASTNPTAQVVTNPLVNRWTLRPSQINTTGSNDRGSVSVTIENAAVSFSITKQSYDISARALPGFTKFHYFGEGVLKTQTEEQPAYVMYTQSYSDSAVNLSFLATPERIRSTMMVFWDTEGNVYEQESLSTAQTSNIYQNYKFGAIYNPETNQSVKATDVTEQNVTQQNQTVVTFRSDPQVQVTYRLHAPLNKATDRTYLWRNAYITGIAQIGKERKDGVGLIETVQPL